MDIIEYVENVLGLKLLEYQKHILKELSIKPWDSRLYMIYGRRGNILICEGPKSKDGVKIC